MMRLVNIVMFAALIGVIIAVWFFRRDYTSRNSEFLPGMIVSVPFNAQDENPNFADDKTLQSPADESEAQNFFPYHYKTTKEDALRAGEELHNPIPDTLTDAIDRGAVVFTNICTPCHGAGGLGDGSVVKRGFPPPPSLLAEKAMKMKDGQIFHILTYGQNNMPSLASQVERLDRWRVIKYVRSLQKKAAHQTQVTSK